MSERIILCLNRVKIVFFIPVVIIFFSSCTTLQNLPQEKISEEKIKIFWEEHDERDFVITYNKDTQNEKELLSDGSFIAPATVVFDTIVDPDLIKEINSWMGTPYKYGKHEKNIGTDCSGFTMEVYKKVYNIDLNRSADGQVANTDTILASDLQTGDLVFFKTRGNRISHVGIYLSNNKFVHATVKKGVMINDMDEEYYRSRYVQAGRVKPTR